MFAGMVIDPDVEFGSRAVSALMTHVCDAGLVPKKPPAVSRGLLQQGRCLPTDLEVGSATGGAGLGAKDVTGGDELDPK